MFELANLDLEELMTTPREKFLEFLRYHRYEQDEARQIADKAAEFFAEPAQSDAVGESERLNGKTPWEFACDWYKPGEIAYSIARSKAGFGPFAIDSKIPGDVYSQEFAEWLTDQYRLAMRKGIEVGQADNARLTTALREAEERVERLERTAREVAADMRAHFSEVELVTSDSLIGGWRDQLLALLPPAASEAEDESAARAAAIEFARGEG